VRIDDEALDSIHRLRCTQSVVGYLGVYLTSTSEAAMKALVSVTFLLLSLLGYSNFAEAQEEVQVKPHDVYISVLGGYSFPFKAHMLFGGLEVQDVKFENVPSIGGKVGMWITAPRKNLGIDIGAEIDVIRFRPNHAGGQVLSSNLGPGILVPLNLDATYFGVNVLARLPIGVTPELPNGRCFPYIGVGGGGQRLSLEFSGQKDTNIAPAFQGLGGIKVFVTRHIAVFAEGKFIHASHAFRVQGGGTVELDLNSVHGIGGLSVHF
jgi:hypothetical protein